MVFPCKIMKEGRVSYPSSLPIIVTGSPLISLIAGRLKAMD